MAWSGSSGCSSFGAHQALELSTPFWRDCRMRFCDQRIPTPWQPNERRGSGSAAVHNRRLPTCGQENVRSSRGTESRPTPIEASGRVCPRSPRLHDGAVDDLPDGAGCDRDPVGARTAVMEARTKKEANHQGRLRRAAKAQDGLLIESLSIVNSLG